MCKFLDLLPENSERRILRNGLGQCLNLFTLADEFCKELCDVIFSNRRLVVSQNILVDSIMLENFFI
jgi:hypothetical protein